MTTPKLKRRKRIEWRLIGFAGLVAVVLGIFPIRLMIAHYQAPDPQAVLVLGGDPKREEAAAQLARFDPALEVWVSTGIPYEQSQQIFQSAGLSSSRVHWDYQATDTVTNFTTLVAALQRRQVQHVYIVTSDFHLSRARAIATIVLGSRGIIFTPVAVSPTSPRSPEPITQIIRDTGRAIFWLLTGHTGAEA
jgi:uncharacterized SAM-binding protein YcdF (DUF218 family)